MSELQSTLLIVDPDAEQLFALAGVLKERGYRTLTATSFDQAIAIGIKERIDLVVSECWLQSATSRDLAVKLGVIRRHARLPMIHLARYQTGGVLFEMDGEVPAYHVRKAAVPEANGYIVALLALIELSLQSTGDTLKKPVPVPNLNFGQSMNPVSPGVSIGQ